MSNTNTHGEWKVFGINDCDWWVARSLSEAVEDAKKCYGEDMPDMITEARELTPEEMEKLQYGEDQENTVKFRQELERMVSEGLSIPRLFATTEH